jgi:hypothetical protein
MSALELKPTVAAKLRAMAVVLEAQAKLLEHHAREMGAAKELNGALLHTSEVYLFISKTADVMKSVQAVLDDELARFEAELARGRS